MVNIFRISLFLFCFFHLYSSAQLPFYYKVKKVKGVVYDQSNNAIHVQFVSRRKLRISNCKYIELDSFLRCLTIEKVGRKELEHLLTSSAKTTIIISPKIGIMYKDGKYRLIAGMTGPLNSQSNDLIQYKKQRLIKKWRHTYNFVYKESTIEIFKASLIYSKKNTYSPSKNEVKIFDWKTNEEIKNFSMDTIKIEPLMHPDMMYKNEKELYYFAGLHEIVHTRPKNIELQEAGRDAEWDAIGRERKAFKKRKRINARKVKYLKVKA